MRDLWLLTVAQAERVAEVESLIDSMGLPKNRNVVVAHHPTFLRTDKAEVVDYEGEEFNISKWWDAGLDFIYKKYRNSVEEFDILVIESDVRMTREDVDHVREVMRAHDCAMAGPDWQGCLASNEVKVRRDNSVWVSEGKEPWQSRLPGMGVVIAGELELDHEPLYPRFWFADDHFEWTARENGGTVLVGGTTLHHTGTQGPLTGELKKYAEEDERDFELYWEGLPNFGGQYEK